MAKSSKSSPRDNSRHSSRFSRFWRRLRSTPTPSQNPRVEVQETLALNIDSQLVRYIEGIGSSTPDVNPSERQRYMSARPPSRRTECSTTRFPYSQPTRERYMTTQSPLLENQQNRASNRLARSDYSSQGRGGRSQVIPLQGGNLRPPAQTCHVETGRPMRNLERSLRSHPAPAVLAKGCDSAKSVYDILLKWLTAEESQSTIVLLGMASITTTGLVTYLASGNICIAAIEIAKAMSVNGSSAVVGVAKVAAPALAGMGVYMYLGTQVIWGASDMIRGYVLGPSARVSRSANGYGRVLGEIDDQPTLLRSLMSPPRRSSRIRLSEPTTSQRRIGN